MSGGLWDLSAFTGKAIIFIGRGREGESFERFIKKYAQISSFLFIDQQDDPAYLESLRTLDMTKTVVVKTAGCPGRLVHAPYTTPTKVFFDCVRSMGSMTVGVTGTKGKTTTTSLIGAMLKNAGKDVRVCGNIGTPMLDALEGAGKDTIFVLELSSYQLAELEVSPHIAVITNLYRDHVDYHGNLEAYWEAKRNIMRYMTEQDTLVFNPQAEVVFHWLAESSCKSIAVNMTQQIDMSKSKLIGEHNQGNALLARTAAELLGADRLTTQATIDEFEPIKHRLQPVRTVRGVNYVDDAIGSTPEATIAGITALIKQVGPVGCLLLGGQNRDYDFSELAKMIYRIGIPKLVLFPETGPMVRALLPESFQPECFETTSMEEAVKWASEHCPSGSICLLSTGAPSYSLWKDFEEKGDLFQKAVMALTS